MTALDRRTLLKAACAGCAAFGLASCGGAKSPATAGSATAGSATAGSATAGSAKTPISTTIVKVADIPIGGSASGKSPQGKALLLARPTATTVVAFSAICTHQGCTVEPSGKQLACPCHGSVYDAFTGKVLSGPAPAPLHTFAVKISGADVVPA